MAYPDPAAAIPHRAGRRGGPAAGWLRCGTRVNSGRRDLNPPGSPPITGAGARAGRHRPRRGGTAMTDTYAAPELTEVGEFAADTLGLGGVLYDATARHSY
ncbi:hypothetical protein GCM10023222_28900 [Saccharopolyspora cebuensis]